MTDTNDALDKTDRRILQALQADGRMSNLQLAQTVALSPTAALARTQRLQRSGYILGYEARLNPLKLGLGLTVFVEVLLDSNSFVNFVNRWVFLSEIVTHDNELIQNIKSLKSNLINKKYAKSRTHRHCCKRFCKCCSIV